MCAGLLSATSSSFPHPLQSRPAGQPEHSPRHCEVTSARGSLSSGLIINLQMCHRPGGFCLVNLRLHDVPGGLQPHHQEGPGSLPDVPLLPRGWLDGHFPLGGLEAPPLPPHCCDVLTHVL